MLSLTHRALGYLLSPIPVLTWLTCLLRHFRAIRGADVIVQARRPCAFGTTLNMIEVARRLHPGQRILLLVFREPSNHNPKLGLLFGNLITFVSWPRPCVRFELFGKRVILPPRPLHDIIASTMSHWWFRYFARRGVVLYDQTSLYDAMPKEDDVLATFPKQPDGNPIINGHTINGLLSRFFNNVEAPPIALPRSILESIEARIQTVTGSLPNPAKGYCGMHLKEDETGDTFKDGSNLEAYLPAMRKVAGAGYRILLKGDRRMPRDILASFGGMVVDSQILGVDEDLFNLFVITESSIFIGDSGPGTWMAGAIGIPILALNVFPIGLGFSATWVCFKTCHDGEGRKASAKILFSEIAEMGNRPAHWSERPMQAEEITQAVEDFLSELRPQPGQHEFPELVALLPEWSCFRVIGLAHLSPSWVRNHYPEYLDQTSSKFGSTA